MKKFRLALVCFGMFLAGSTDPRARTIRTNLLRFGKAGIEPRKPTGFLACSTANRSFSACAFHEIILPNKRATCRVLLTRA